MGEAAMGGEKLGGAGEMVMGAGGAVGDVDLGDGLWQVAPGEADVHMRERRDEGGGIVAGQLFGGLFERVDAMARRHHPIIERVLGGGGHIAARAIGEQHCGHLTARCGEPGLVCCADCRRKRRPVFLTGHFLTPVLKLRAGHFLVRDGQRGEQDALCHMVNFLL